MTVKTELGERWKLQADAEEDEAADDADSEEIVLGDDDEDEDEFSEDDRRTRWNPINDGRVHCISGSESTPVGP